MTIFLQLSLSEVGAIISDDDVWEAESHHEVCVKLNDVVIRPICITILYHNLLLFIDIFHIMDMILMLFPLFCMYDDYEGNNCRSQILMEKHRQDTIFMKIRSFGKSYFTEFCTRRRR